MAMKTMRVMIAKSDVPDAMGLSFSASCLRAFARDNKSIILADNADGSVTAYKEFEVGAEIVPGYIASIPVTPIATRR